MCTHSSAWCFLSLHDSDSESQHTRIRDSPHKHTAAGSLLGFDVGGVGGPSV